MKTAIALSNYRGCAWQRPPGPAPGCMGVDNAFSVGIRSLTQMGDQERGRRSVQSANVQQVQQLAVRATRVADGEQASIRKNVAGGGGRVSHGAGIRPLSGLGIADELLQAA